MSSSNLPRTPDAEGVAALVATSALSEAEAQSLYPEAVSDPAFRRWLDIHRNTLAAVAAPEAVTAPEGLRQRILDDVSRTRQGRNRAPWFAGAAAAAALLAGIGIWTFAAPDEPEPRVYAAAVADGTLTVSVAPGADVATLALDDVPPPTEGTVYQMWVNTPDGAVSLGTMGPDDVSTHTEVEVGGFRDASEFMITAEDSGGSDSPSEPIVSVLLD